MLKALIFDMDGLMVDTEPLYGRAGRRIAEHFGKTLMDATLGKMAGRGPLDSMRIFAEDLGIAESAQSLLDRRTQIMSAFFRAGVTPMPGLREILQAFQGRLKLAVATSSPRAFTDLILPPLGIDRCFDVIQTSDAIANHKPHPEIYLAAMDKLGVTGEESVVLEDSQSGSRAGKSAGAYVVAAPNGHTATQDFGFVDFLARDLFHAAEHIHALLEKHE